MKFSSITKYIKNAGAASIVNKVVTEGLGLIRILPFKLDKEALPPKLLERDAVILGRNQFYYFDHLTKEAQEFTFNNADKSIHAALKQRCLGEYTLATEDEIQLIVAAVKRTLPHPLHKSEVDAIAFRLSTCGYNNETIMEIIIPRLVAWQMEEGAYSMERLGEFLETLDDKGHAIPPVRVQFETYPKQRRFDSLARLLSVNETYTPCVATALFKGELILAYNSSLSQPAQLNDDMSKYLNYKIAMIREFLNSVINEYKPLQLDGLSKIKFPHALVNMASDVVDAITSEKNGGCAKVLPLHHRHPKRNKVKEHLVSALLKIAEQCLLGVYSNGEKGFNREELQALVHSDSFVLATAGRTAPFDAGQLHAEQAILGYLIEHTDFMEIELEEKVYIGVSYLCCQTCQEVLSRYANKVHFRGGHGVGFTNVLDFDSGAAHAITPTIHSIDLCASDSGSECSYDVESLPSPDTLEGLKPNKIFFEDAESELELLALEIERRGESSMKGGTSAYKQGAKNRFFAFDDSKAPCFSLEFDGGIEEDESLAESIEAQLSERSEVDVLKIHKEYCSGVKIDRFEIGVMHK